MPIRFIVGRAGSGKTHHCLTDIRQRLLQDPIDGPRLILLVPEQASMQMERAILEPAPDSTSPASAGVAHRAEVLSFRRLALRVLDSGGGAVPTVLSEPARAMVLRHLLTRNSRELQYYGRMARRSASDGRLSGLVERLGATIVELMQEAIEPAELEVAAGADDPTEDDENPVQRAKLHDVRLIYEAYLGYLGTDRLDPSQYLQAARPCFERCDWLSGAQLWADGFASMSGQESLMLVALAKQCYHTDITVLMDPALCRDGASSPAEVRSAARLFSRTLRTYHDLHDRFARAGLAIEEPLVLTGRPRRFSTGGALATIERRWADVTGGKPAGSAGSAEPAAPPEPAESAKTDAESRAVAEVRTEVEVVELPSRRIEVDYAVSRICRWVQDPAMAYRYRDLAIIARDLDPYHDLISEALDARGIPFFIDRRRPVVHHPLVELLRSILSMAADDMSLESVRQALKTGFFSLSVDTADKLDTVDELENLLLAHGIAGSKLWRADDWSFGKRNSIGERVNKRDDATNETLRRTDAARRSFMEQVDPWLSVAMAAEPRTGDAWSVAITSLLVSLEAGEMLAQWAAEAESDGDLDGAEEHRQVWTETQSFLDDLAEAFREVELTISELTDVVEAGLAGLTLGLVPPMVDQVLVGSIERSRHPDIKAVVVVGFNDGIFPKQLTEDSILNDDDRRALNEAGIGVRPGARESVFDESMLAYVALTRAAESLVVTFAETDAAGKALRPSPYIDRLAAACPGLVMKSPGDPARLREAWDVLAFSDLTERLATEFRSRPTREKDTSAIRGRWNELYDTTRASLSESVTARRGLSSLGQPRRACLSPETIARHVDTTLRTSVSELETYAACHFQHLAKYELRLRERKLAPLQAVDVGLVHHAILEDFVQTLTGQDRSFQQLSEGELLDGLGESCTRIAAQLEDGKLPTDGRSSYVLRRTASHLARVMRVGRKRSQAGGYRPRAAELPFGFDRPHSLPAIELSTPGGRRVLLRGYIDRVDLVELGDELLGVVIDYKSTGDKRLNLGQVYHGLSLQLIAYLLAIQEGGETLAGRPVRPAGALYVSLASRYQSVDHPDAVPERDRMLEGTYRPHGLFLADSFAELDRSTESGWSQHYCMYRGKDGSVGYIDKSDAAESSDFQALMDHTRMRLGQLADGILDGDVAVRPYRLGTFSPCSWCAMASVCRFEMGVSEIRFLETLKRSEVFRKLTGEASQRQPGSS